MFLEALPSPPPLLIQKTIKDTRQENDQRLVQLQRDVEELCKKNKEKLEVLKTESHGSLSRKTRFPDRQPFSESINQNNNNSSQDNETVDHNIDALSEPTEENEMIESSSSSTSSSTSSDDDSSLESPSSSDTESDENDNSDDETLKTKESMREMNKLRKDSESNINVNNNTKKVSHSPLKSARKTRILYKDDRLPVVIEVDEETDVDLLSVITDWQNPYGYDITNISVSYSVYIDLSLILWI